MKTEDEIKEQICLLTKELEQNIDNENAIAIYGLGINLLKWVIESEEEGRMTSNINGIDVSECVFFKERYTRIGDDVDNDISFENHCMLSEYPFNIGNCEKINCYFKQFKRLQEENAELYDKNVQLQKENDKLKAEIKNNKTALQTELGVYNMECGNLLKENEELLDKNAKYRQALEEIKKWATNHNPCDIEEGFNCTMEDCLKCLNYDIKRIKTIINEVFK